jgi:folate-binding protein YgfZ
VPATSTDDAVRALDAGLAHAELDEVTLTVVTGADARRWLGDLVTTDVASLGDHETRPSLLLTPTGRIRAAFHVLGLGEGGFALAQGPGQPTPLRDLLAPYVLSSDVVVTPSDLRLFALPGRSDPPPDAPDAWRPSVIGDGVDLLVDGDDGDAVVGLRRRLGEGGIVASTGAAVEARRIRRGDARFPTDLDGDSLPAEAGWDAAPTTDRAKGCFLGQEAVAKVANLGHPTRTVAPVAAREALAPGEPVLARGREVGLVTSADGLLGIVRIRWDARDDPLVTASGIPVERR